MFATLILGSSLLYNRNFLQNNGAFNLVVTSKERLTNKITGHLATQYNTVQSSEEYMFEIRTR